MKTNCKRMTVHAMGVDRSGNIAYARNYSPDVCLNIPGNCGCVHAEAALLQLLPDPVKVVISHSPCLNCAKLLVDAGVEEVYFIKEYRLPDGLEYLHQNGVKIYKI